MLGEGGIMKLFSNGNTLSKLNNNCYLLDIKTPSTKETIIDIFKSVGINVEEMLREYNEVFDVGQAEFLELDGIFIFVYKNGYNYFISLKEKDSIRSFRLFHKYCVYSLFKEGIETNSINEIKKFIDTLAELKRSYPLLLLYDLYTLYDDTNLINEFNYQVVIDDEEIELMLPAFRDVKDAWKNLSIVLKSTKEDVGHIEFNLSDDNFKYVGNVEYVIKEKYRKKGYATRALALVKRLVAEYEREVDKTLYISTEVDSLASQGVILKNGGTLYYEGEVPKGDKVFFLNKVDYVKIYTIDANAL